MTLSLKKIDHLNSDTKFKIGNVQYLGVITSNKKRMEWNPTSDILINIIEIGTIQDEWYGLTLQCDCGSYEIIELDELYEIVT